MSLSLARKSLRLLENDSKPKLKKDIKPKAVNMKRKVPKDDQATKVKKLLLLNKSTMNDTTAKTLLKKATNTKRISKTYRPVHDKKPKETDQQGVFTEEDFKAFEEEYKLQQHGK